MPKDFKEYCEDLYQNWKTNTNFFDEFSDDFKTDYLPEPYYVIQEGQKTLYVLNNNPGDKLPIQKKEEFSSIPTYEEAAKKMAECYQNPKIIGKAADRRIQNMKKFAKEHGFDGVKNIETFFLHSKSFNNKNFLKKYYKNGEGLKLVIEYLESLQSYLKDKPALAITAVESKTSITIDSLQNNPWVQLMCKTINLDLQNATFTPTSMKGDKVTSALLIDDKNQKYMTLMMGSNNIPRNAVYIK